AFGYHGNGVNTATWAGRELAAWLAAGERAPCPDTVPRMLRGLCARFPVASLRLAYLQARLAVLRLQDALGCARRAAAPSAERERERQGGGGIRVVAVVVRLEL